MDRQAAIQHMEVFLQHRLESPHADWPLAPFVRGRRLRYHVGKLYDTLSLLAAAQAFAAQSYDQTLICFNVEAIPATHLQSTTAHLQALVGEGLVALCGGPEQLCDAPYPFIAFEPRREPRQETDHRP